MHNKGYLLTIDRSIPVHHVGGNLRLRFPGLDAAFHRIKGRPTNINGNYIKILVLINLIFLKNIKNVKQYNYLYI